MDEEIEPQDQAPARGERPERRRLVTATQIIVVFAITAALWLGLDFSRRISSAQRIQGDVLALDRELHAEETRSAELAQQLKYVQSDDYVEQWARSEMKMVRPGERLVVPVIVTPQVSAPPAPAAPPSPPSPLTVWWIMLFGDERTLQPQP